MDEDENAEAEEAAVVEVEFTVVIISSPNQMLDAS
jgi:hypothetical protein